MTETNLNKNGCTITNDRGQFAYEEYYSPIAQGMRVQWDYRDSKGRLYSGIAKSIEAAKAEAQKQSGEMIP